MVERPSALEDENLFGNPIVVYKKWLEDRERRIR
jgi:hypothetical protein